MNLNFKKNNNTNMKNPKVPEGNQSERRSAHRGPKCPKDVEVPEGRQSARRRPKCPKTKCPYLLRRILTLPRLNKSM